MTQADVLQAFVAAFVDELALCGLKHVNICPGSRSTPLAVLFHRHPGFKVWTHLDERSAAYFALGQAKAGRQPAAVLGTSGTATLNFAPAVAEAFYSRLPLLIVTADRPPELQEVGATQTISQSRLYGRHVKKCVDMSLPEGGSGALRYVRATANRAIADSMAARAGPIHVNFPFREPLIPESEERMSSAPPSGPSVSVIQGPQTLPSSKSVELAGELRQARRGLIVCGPQDEPAFPGAVVRLGQMLNFPVLADILSQVRRGAHARDTIDSYDAFLRDPRIAGELVPDFVLRFGATPVSKPLQQYLQGLQSSRQLLIAPADEVHDPALVATDRLQVDPCTFCEVMLSRLSEMGERDDGLLDWGFKWQRLNGQARSVLKDCLADDSVLSEPGVFDELGSVLPPGATLFAGNSMPVRDLDSFCFSDSRSGRFLANRGASGIDGVVSTALGVSSVNDSPCLLAIGDLSLYHDMNGLLAARKHGLRATIVVLHNDGGGIFSFLPQAEAVASFEELFGTPHGLDFRHAAGLYGLDYCEVKRSPEFRAALEESFRKPGVSLIVVRTNREANVHLHRRLWRAVSQGVRHENPEESSPCTSR